MPELKTADAARPVANSPAAAPVLAVSDLQAWYGESPFFTASISM